MTNEQKQLENSYMIGTCLAERALYGFDDERKTGKRADWASDALWSLNAAIEQHEAWSGDPCPDHLPPYDRLSEMLEMREEVRRYL